jgi:hypothetical protein
MRRENRNTNRGNHHHRLGRQVGDSGVLSESAIASMIGNLFFALVYVFHSNRTTCAEKHLPEPVRRMFQANSSSASVSFA